MKFTRQELKEIVKAWFITSLAFAIAITVRDFGLSATLGPTLLIPFMLSFLTVGLGVILHELGHKFFGQRFGGDSYFKAFDKFLGVGVLLAFTGFLFVLPGAVYTRNRVSRSQLGIIALAGPATNFLLGIAFIPLLFTTGLALAIGQMGVEINFLLAVFNLLPLGMFDGAKVLAWNKYVWAACITLSGIATFLALTLVRGGL